MNLTDIAALVIGALSKFWERWTTQTPLGWLGLCGTIAVFSLVSIAIHIGRIRELMEGPTQECRYCRRRYPFTDGIDLGRTCYRRACQKRYYRWRTEREKAENIVLERWKAIAPEADGVLSNENLKRRDEELTEAEQDVERRYGGEPSVREKDE